MSNCIFCDIIARRLPAEILYEDDSAISILDINPIHYGHALIIPKAHYKDFLELPQNHIPGLFHSAQIVAQSLVTGFKLEGLTSFQTTAKLPDGPFFTSICPLRCDTRTTTSNLSSNSRVTKAAKSNDVLMSSGNTSCKKPKETKKCRPMQS